MLPERRERDPWLPALALVLVVAASVVSAFISMYAGWACSSGDEAPGSLEADLCDGLYDGVDASSAWWVAVLWPVVAFGASQFIPMFRRRPLVVAVPVAILVVAFWVATAVVVIDV
jgi:hypothetical protein